MRIRVYFRVYSNKKGHLIDPKLLLQFNYKLENSKAKQEKIENLEILL